MASINCCLTISLEVIFFLLEFLKEFSVIVIFPPASNSRMCTLGKLQKKLLGTHRNATKEHLTLAWLFLFSFTTLRFG